MTYINFVPWFLFLLINLKLSNNSLVSRYKSQNEYVPSDPGKLLLPEDIDDTLYEELLLEVPHLRGQLRKNKMTPNEYSMLPYLKSHKSYETDVDEDFDMEANDQEAYPTRLDYESDVSYNFTSTERMPFLKRKPPIAEDLNSLASSIRPNGTWLRDTRRKGWWPRRLENAKRKATCYWCGMDHREKLPRSSICHDAFESPDWRARTMARFFRARCFQYPYYYEHIDSYKMSNRIWFLWDRGLVRAKYGPYYGGCFKRFTDVGKIYTQRGCRSHFPAYTTANFATHRFRRLELLIRKERDYCIVSPHASLTPFSRAISLYVRYHVCVCTARYCNSARAATHHAALIFFTLLYFILYLMGFFVEFSFLILARLHTVRLKVPIA